jgi:hypothetical protein
MKSLSTLPSETATRLLALLAVAVGACLVAVVASGVGTIEPRNAAVAAVSAIAAVTALALARRRRELPRPAASAPSLDRTKKILALAMACGAIAYVGGRATFGLFNAETTNPDSSMASGTLVMGNKVDSGTTCVSSSGATLDNVNDSCDVALTLANMAPGVSSAQAKLTVENDGSLDASKFTLFAPYPRTSLNGALTDNVATGGSLTVAALKTAVATGDVVMVSDGGHSQTFTVAAPGASAGATAIPITSALANYSYPVGSRVDDTSGNTGASNTQCYDVKTTTSTVAGATVGTALNFNPTTGNPLCSALDFWIQEQTNGFNYCWYGRGSAASPAPSAAGQCRTPTTASLSGAVTAGSPLATVAVSALTGNVKSGDVLTITQGTHTDTFTASAAAYIGDTTIAVSPSWSPSYAYTGAATITDTTAVNDFVGDTTDTISAFDTGHKAGATAIELHPLTGNNAYAAAATIELNRHNDAGYQRVFYVGVFLPASGTAAQNQLQGLSSTFGLSWHVDQ